MTKNLCPNLAPDLAPNLAPTALKPVSHIARVDDGPRHWSRARQAEFLRQLASTHCVSRAAKHVGMSRQSAYRLRNRLKGEPFDIAWQCAFRRQFDVLAEAALARALNGVEVPHFHKGELIHVSRKFDERLTVALLAMQGRLNVLPPDRYAEQSQFAPDDFDALVERVASGDELWAELDDVDVDTDKGAAKSADKVPAKGDAKDGSGGQ